MTLGLSEETTVSQMDKEVRPVVIDERLGRRLAYILRYGAEKEGLGVHKGGYVELMQLLKVPMLKWYQPYQILQCVETSVSNAKRRRFEKKYENGSIYIRALYGRRMERNPNHEDSGVTRLLEICLSKVADDISQYDLQNFPDEFILNTLIHKMRRQKRLNNRVFRAVLGPTIQHLDLGAVYLTEATMKLVAQRCPELRVLNLRDSGYLLNDHIMEIFLKKMPQLESLNLAGCRHLTDRTLVALCRRCPKIRTVNLSHIPAITQEGVLNLVTLCDDLIHLDLLGNHNVSEAGRETLQQISEERTLTVLLDSGEIKSPSVEAGNASLTLPLAGVGQNW